ncbi:YqaA family protein [Parasphaerochaeta coccoides]|uniref:SNARE associated Golgi protein-related protein n=1 Tax=Parasphaerochaeta coccoides (strain ATCC BAA-1237 / DSM 17374 / SPN1) TaxID=760011 RepID=F4GM33_PARC1|nr:VTT domain-containing protein [Parasphaerochaeta coccoides]AEC02508.1 SNARE associated Golgi protein-related protein [Parasphaerochaeta coccoides DSM 17374]
MGDDQNSEYRNEDTEKPMITSKKEKIAAFFKKFTFDDFISTEGELNWVFIVRRGAVLVLIFILFYLAIMYVTTRHFEQFAHNISTTMGSWGVALVAAIDGMVMAPVSADILFPFIVQSRWTIVRVMMFMGLASAVGGYCGYWIGRLFDKVPFVRRMIDSIPDKVNRLAKRYGAWAVALSGLLPIPFSAICLLAGVLKVPHLSALTAMLTRIPRMGIYYLLFAAGGKLVSFL